MTHSGPQFPHLKNGVSNKSPSGCYTVTGGFACITKALSFSPSVGIKSTCAHWALRSTSELIPGLTLSQSQAVGKPARLSQTVQRRVRAVMWPCVGTGGRPGAEARRFLTPAWLPKRRSDLGEPPGVCREVRGSGGGLGRRAAAAS